MYDQKDMFYRDYIWNARADLDNPKIVGGNDRAELNRSEGYEMLYFIRSLAKTWGWKDDAIRGCQKLERTIRTKVPGNIRTHGEIKDWIQNNFRDFWDGV